HQELEANLHSEGEITKPPGKRGHGATNAKRERAELHENERCGENPPVWMGVTITFRQIKREADQEETELRSERNEVGDQCGNRDGQTGKVNLGEELGVVGKNVGSFG